MNITPEQLKAMRLVEQDKVYWTRQGGSRDYAANVHVVRQLISMGYVLCVPDGCCNKDFMLTEAGKKELANSVL